MSEIRVAEFIGDLVICKRCSAIRGVVPYRKDGAEQRCDCTPQEVRAAEPVWGGDFNKYAELCRCCGLELLSSGTRYSVWFCDPCKALVRALNHAVGFYLIPIGRHSVMNHIGITQASIRNRAAIEQLTADLKGMFGRIEGIEAYARDVVAFNRKALGFTRRHDVKLVDYLARARTSDLTVEDAFARLVVRTFLGSPTAAPAAS